MAHTKHCAGTVGLEECACVQVGKTVELLSMRGNVINVFARETSDEAFELQREIDAEIDAAVH